MRIQVQLFTLLRIQIQLFTLLQIQILAPHKRDANATTGLQTLKGSTLSLHAPTVSVTALQGSIFSFSL
jgi:hypothetical protein